MIKALQKYHEFVDALVSRRVGVLERRVREKGWPRLAENEDINQFIDKLTSHEREIVARILKQARDGGIHDTLAYLQERIDRRSLQLIVDGDELPVLPYGTELYWDWVARAEGKAWPSRTTEQ